ncbi:MAG TPA: ADOP family duplicated permease [Bryobacteraceae bacterium]|nr:ADOP family duplicated permease [Bryobacteraceae bacterium]
MPPRLDALAGDVAFGWRQIKKRKVASIAAILSLALAIGASTAAFRLIDALLLRPLPIAHPENLYLISFEGTEQDGTRNQYDSCSYPMFLQWRSAAGDRAELVAASYTERTDLTYGSDQETEKAYLEYVSGGMFTAFGLRPSAGRLFTANDDRIPGAHPYAIISHDYWKRRFGMDRGVIRRSFRIGTGFFEIVGVAPDGFTGVEPGTMPDIYLPMLMHGGSAIRDANSFWFRTFIIPKPGVALDSLKDQLYATYRSSERERAKTFTNFPKNLLEGYPRDKLQLVRAVAGVSEMQEHYRRALLILGGLVALVLLIACANVANLMAAQAASRVREMALRVSIGAGRWHLVRMLIVECVMLAAMAAAGSALLAWGAAPFVVRMINRSDNPARLSLETNWHVFGFGLVLILAVTTLLAAPSAWRAALMQPVNGLRGGENPLSRGRFMHLVIAGEVAFCFIVVFLSYLFVSTFERISRHPTGFSSERLLAVETVAQQAQPVHWSQLVRDLSGQQGIESVALAGWPLLSGRMSNNFISIHGAPPSKVLAYFLGVSPGWFETMRVPLLDGRDFNLSDVSPGAAIVNEVFARQFFAGRDPVGETFVIAGHPGEPIRIVGLARNALYQSVREPMLPVVYVPFQSVNNQGTWQVKNAAAIMVRTSVADPLMLAPILRQAVARWGHGFRVSSIRPQSEINASQTVRERLLATLALFFGSVALLLAGIGLYGVMHHFVSQRRREIGVRVAIGAGKGDIARFVAADAGMMVVGGAAAGIGIGVIVGRFAESLLYEVNATAWGAVALPAGIMFVVALLAALPAVVRAIRIDPALVLRGE